jgi:hypothetical protein
MKRAQDRRTASDAEEVPGCFDEGVTVTLPTRHCHKNFTRLTQRTPNLRGPAKRESM